jgi:hypothetical protein
MNPINSKYEDVYFVYAGPKSKLNPIAIRPEIHENYMKWEDTSRGGFASIAEIEMEPKDSTTNPQKILIKTLEGDKIIFLQLNLKIYNEKVRNWVYNQPKFNSDSEVKNFYLTTNFHEY